MASRETIPVTIEVRAQCNCGRWRFDKDVGGYVSADPNMGILAIGGQCQTCGDNLVPIYTVTLGEPKAKRGRPKGTGKKAGTCQEPTVVEPVEPVAVEPVRATYQHPQPQSP